MKILLINPLVRENEPPKNIPIGLAIIAQVLRNEGHQVQVLDVNGERFSDSEVCTKLAESDYDIVGLGGLITTYNYMKWIIPKIKEYRPNSKVIVGGGVVTENPDLLISRTPADIAVIGEGEITMKELVSALGKGGSLENIKGIAYKENGQIVRTPARPLIKNLDELPFPAWDLFPMHIYLHNLSHAYIIGKKTEVNILTSRGCPYNCRYCYHIFGRGVRFRSVDNVIEEIKELLQNYEIQSISFKDETFTANKKNVMEFCDKFIEERIGLSWACYARVDRVDEEMLKRMKQAGCFWVGYGIESGSQKILDNMRKGVTVEQAKRAIHLTRDAGLYCGVTFMFGYPGETVETIEEMVNFCKQMNLLPTLFFTTPYPGTELYEELKGRIIERYGTEEKFIERLGDASEFTANLTDFSDEELFRLKEDAERRLRKISLVGYLKLIALYYKQTGLTGLISLLKRKIERRVGSA